MILSMLLFIWKKWHPLDSKKACWQLAKGMALLILIFFSIHFCLRLWTEQSKRYYKKLAYAYLVIAEVEKR